MLAALIIGCLIVAFILIMSVPVDIKIDWDAQQKPFRRFRLEWFFGILGKEVTGKRPKSPGKKSKQRKKLTLTKRLQYTRDLVEILRVKGLLKRILRLIRDIFKQCKLRYFSGDIRIGLGDPADTGFFFGIIYLVTPFTDRFTVDPDFSGEIIFEGRLKVIIRLFPIRLTLPLARFVFSMAAFKLARTFIVQKWKRRKYTLSYQP